MIKDTLTKTLLGVSLFGQHLLYHSKIKGLTSVYPMVHLQMGHQKRFQVILSLHHITLAVICKN